VSELTTVKELSFLLRVSASTVYRMVRDREIGYIRTRGGIRFSRPQISKFLRSHTVRQDGRFAEALPRASRRVQR